jgi:hypothetical protein
MRRVVAWLCSHPLTTGFLVLIGCAVGTHLFANWRAEVRWQHYCTEARARGVKLTLAEFAPPEIPDAENFAALPMFRAIFNGGVQRPMELPTTNGTRPEFGNALKGERMDWTAWQTFFKDAGYISETTDSPPRDVLRGVEHYAPQFKEWGEWRTRPRCRFTLDTKDIMAMPFPHLGTFVDAAKLFALRLRAHIALGDSAAACVDFREGLQAHRGLVEEPVLLSGLVQTSALNTVLQAVGDGLAQRAWANAELKALGDDLSLIRVCADYLRAFSSERGYGNQFGEDILAVSPLQRGKKLIAMNAAAIWKAPGSYPPSWAFVVVPKRLYRDNQLRSNLHMDEICARVTDDQTQFQSSAGTPTSLESLEGLDAYYYFIFSHSNDVFSEVGVRFVRLQTQLDQTRLAIALERFRLARGAYPETLAELVPEFIAAVPVETYSRQPMIYRRQEGGTFLLYGVGKDRKDDGGAVDPKLHEKKQLDDIWLYAPPAR